MDNTGSVFDVGPRVAERDAPERMRHAMEFARFSFEKGGAVPLVYLIHEPTPEGPTKITVIDVENMHAPVAALLGRQIGQRTGEVIYVAEAWQVKSRPEDDDKDKDLLDRLRRERRLDLHPQREECAIVTYATPERTLWARASIVRKPSSRLCPWQVILKTENLSGRFIEFF